MANITLPSNPVNGQKVTIGTRLFEYNSTTGRWSSRVFQVLGDTSIAVTNQAPTITASLSEVALDTSGANVLFTYTVSDVDSSVLKISHEVNGVTNSSYATVYHHKANNTVTIQAGTEEFSSANVVLTVTDGRNNASVSVDVSASYGYAFGWPDMELTLDANQTEAVNIDNNLRNRGTGSNPGTSLWYGTTRMPESSESPYRNSHGIRFGGSDYFSITTATLAITGTDAFTIEMWIKADSLSGTQFIADYGGLYGSVQGNYTIYLSGSTLRFETSGNVPVATTTLKSGSWHHIALTGDGTNLRAFLDGSLLGTTTHNSMSAGSSGKFDIASLAGSGFFTGRISNLRIVKGSAVYTSAFTPATENLTAISGTELLIGNTYDFRDSSTNNFDLSITGSPQIDEDNPFGDDKITDDSGYGSVAGISQSTKYEWWVPVSWNHTSAWYIDFWYYHEYSSNKTFVVQRTGGGSPSTVLSYDGSNFSIGSQGRNRLSISRATWNSHVKNKTWSHHHVQFTGPNPYSYSYYVNGTRIGYLNNGTFAPPTDNTDRLGFGSHNTSTNYSFNGKVADFTFDQSNLYNHASSITVPTAPKNDTTKQVYIPFDNAGYFDASGKHRFTYSSTGIRAASSPLKFSNQPIYFPNKGDYITTVDKITLGTSDFCLEGWFYFTDLSGGNVYMFGAEGWVVQFGRKTSGIAFWDSSGHLLGDSSQPLTTNTWYHMAWNRYNGTIKTWINGTEYSSRASNPADYGSVNLNMGISTSGNSSQGFPGYMLNVQLIVGEAKYTSDFTPPTQIQGSDYQVVS